MYCRLHFHLSNSSIDFYLIISLLWDWIHLNLNQCKARANRHIITLRYPQEKLWCQLKILNIFDLHVWIRDVSESRKCLLCERIHKMHQRVACGKCRRGSLIVISIKKASYLILVLYIAHGLTWQALLLKTPILIWWTGFENMFAFVRRNHLA